MARIFYDFNGGRLIRDGLFYFEEMVRGTERGLPLDDNLVSLKNHLYLKISLPFIRDKHPSYLYFPANISYRQFNSYY